MIKDEHSLNDMGELPLSLLKVWVILLKNTILILDNNSVNICFSLSFLRIPLGILFLNTLMA